MELDLDPGDPAAPVLPENGRIPVERNASPVPLSDLLSRLDGDTRGFMTTLLDAWFFHNYSSAAGGGDANGAILRAAVNVNCDQIDNTLDLAPLFRVLVGASTICPAD